MLRKRTVIHNASHGEQTHIGTTLGYGTTHRVGFDHCGGGRLSHREVLCFLIDVADRVVKKVSRHVNSGNEICPVSRRRRVARKFCATRTNHPTRVLCLRGLGNSTATGSDRYLRTENQVLKEKLGKKRILLNDDQHENDARRFSGFPLSRRESAQSLRGSANRFSLRHENVPTLPNFHPGSRQQFSSAYIASNHVDSTRCVALALSLVGTLRVGELEKTPKKDAVD
jgi:hypothetical protein